MTDFAFLPLSTTFNVTTNGTTLTSSSQQVSFATPQSTQPAAQATGLGQVTPQVRVVNTSSGYVYISFTNVPRTAVVPGPTTPSLETVLLPNADRVFTLNAEPTSASIQTLYINTIAAGTSAVLNVTFGEGR